ncbi:cell division protein ZapA [Hirschia litorea]|uniref:Cell division protein ZapA n=1 Tax=Hirschia litorea TaxID=1199156 RepID=A0ABW2IN74_9PROT
MSKAEIIINKKRYIVSCEEGQEERLHELGRRLDARVSSMAQAMGDIGVERLFLASALSLLDELDDVEQNAGMKSLDDRISAIETRAAKALNDAAGRIESLSAHLERSH